MARILNDDDIVNCIFDSDVEVSDLPSDNNSYVDDEDDDPNFLPITTSNILTAVDYSSYSSSESEVEVPIVSKGKKRKYTSKNTSSVVNTNNLKNVLLPTTFDQPSVILPTQTVEYPFVEPKRDKQNEVFTNPVFLSDSNLSPDLLSMENKSPYNLFLQMFPDSLIEVILFQTNLYAQQSQKPYIPATKQELKTFLGLNILMGLKRQPSYRDYWSTAPDLNDSYISKQMTVNRFGWFLINIHCNDSSLEPKRGSPNFDKLYKLKPVIEKLEECIQKSKNLTQDVTIDESMVKFKVYTGKVVGCVEKLLGERVVNDLVTGLNVKRKSKDGSTTMIPCPDVLISYNNNMNNVDVFDQLKAAYGMNRKSRKWWHRVFFHFIDMAIINSFILHQQLKLEKISLKDFLSHHKPHVAPEVRFESSAHQPTRGTLRRWALCSTKAKQKRTEWLYDSTSLNTNNLFDNDNLDSILCSDGDNSYKDTNYLPFKLLVQSRILMKNISLAEFIDPPNFFNDEQVVVHNIVHNVLDNELPVEEGNRSTRKRRMLACEKCNKNINLKQIKTKNQMDKHPVLKKTSSDYTERRKHMSKCINIVVSPTPDLPLWLVDGDD
ncbi:piggyBac transposable element-derived protein 4-like [Aphis craccivora]|uniref:PiggyBac transposable element-derived protein 4-like n=1 Tax=Aphis craccivora TaxID=307492 RepID=A0A6G0YM39_APHCR|nr:piggyBac transposable element-derived protein 4-like [Aphis craccivora]